MPLKLLTQAIYAVRIMTKRGYSHPVFQVKLTTSDFIQKILILKKIQINHFIQKCICIHTEDKFTSLYKLSNNK
jgi:hypothetical protein